MNLSTKKIFAREFLILIAALIVSSLIFLGIYIYNHSLEKDISRLNDKIKEDVRTSDSLKLPLSVKFERRKWYYDNLVSSFEEYAPLSYDTVVSKLDRWALHDSLKYRWDKVWSPVVIGFQKKLGFNSPEQLKSFLDSTRITSQDHSNDSLGAAIIGLSGKDYQGISSIQKKRVSYGREMYFFWKLFIVTFLIVFVFRYIVYGIRWSIRILRRSASQ